MKRDYAILFGALLMLAFPMCSHERLPKIREAYLGAEASGTVPFIPLSISVPNPLGDHSFRQEKFGEFNPGEPLVGQQTMYLYANVQDAVVGHPEGSSAVSHHPKMQPSGDY